jgi:phosphosulfolactate synthase (CoM biosynthesis protein A)
MDRAFSFIPLNVREEKPRKRGQTEIRGPYYSVIGQRHLTDVLEMMGRYIDSIKMPSGCFSLMTPDMVRTLTDLAHKYEVAVSTGGWIERALVYGPDAVEKYLLECKELGFDIVELSAGFVSLPADDMLRLVQKVAKLGLQAKPELGVQFGAGGGVTTVEELESEGSRDARWLIHQAQRCLDAGAHSIIIESEGITENVRKWRTDIVGQIIAALGLEHTMFEAADPEVFEWYVKNYGAEVNMFIDHSQIVQLECLRSGVWGSKSSWGRIVTYKG